MPTPRSVSYQLEEVMAGEEADHLWVTLGIASEHPFDVLHIVVAKANDDQDERLGHDSVYLERRDQSQSCYGGARSIRASCEAVEIDLAPAGQRALGLPASVHIVGCGGVSGFDVALRVFATMRSFPNGRVLTVEAVPPDGV